MSSPLPPPRAAPGTDPEPTTLREGGTQTQTATRGVRPCVWHAQTRLPHGQEGDSWGSVLGWDWWWGQGLVLGQWNVPELVVVVVAQLSECTSN